MPNVVSDHCYALIVSIGAYEDPHLPALPGWRQDALYMQKALSQALFLNDDHICMLPDLREEQEEEEQAEEEHTEEEHSDKELAKEKKQEELSELTGQKNGFVSMQSFVSTLMNFRSLLQPDDTFLLYLSGHCSKTAFCLSDGAVSLTSLQKVLESLPARSRILILDACHAGMIDPSDPAEISLQESLEQFNGKGCALLASCASYEVSRSGSSAMPSLYTAAVHYALLSQTVLDKSSWSLYELSRRIQDLMEGWNEQHPELSQQPIFRFHMGGTLWFESRSSGPFRADPDQAMKPEDADCLFLDKSCSSLALIRTQVMPSNHHKRLIVFLQCPLLCHQQVALLGKTLCKILQLLPQFRRHPWKRSWLPRSFAAQKTTSLSQSPQDQLPADLIACIPGLNEFLTHLQQGLPSLHQKDPLLEGVYDGIWFYLAEDQRDLQMDLYHTWVVCSFDPELQKTFFKPGRYCTTSRNVWVRSNPDYPVLRKLYEPSGSAQVYLQAVRNKLHALMNIMESFIPTLQEMENHQLSLQEVQHMASIWIKDARQGYVDLSGAQVPPEEYVRWHAMVLDLAGYITDTALFFEHAVSKGMDDGFWWLICQNRQHYYEMLESLASYEAAKPDLFSLPADGPKA